MKNYSASVIICLIVFGCCSDAFATNPLNKLARGIGNIPTSFMEIPFAYRRSKDNLDAFSQKHPEEFLTPTVNTPYQYLVKAPLTGIAAMIGRICIGCYDVITFPFSLPRYYAPVYEPEFVWDTMPYAFKIYNQGVIFMDRGRYRQAIVRFTQVLKVEPTNAQALYNRGRAYDFIDQYRKSVDDLNAAESLGFHPELENIKSHNDRY
ncbi:MAG: tetratricopeptide repeat protein [Candidatus Omnitrophota bacterium]